LLSELVLRFPGRRRRADRPDQRAGAESLARELPGLLDELAIDGVPFEKLECWSTETSPLHWQRTLRFLAIVGEHWPKVLEERGQTDALDRRTQSIRAQAARWRERPPSMPVIAAGSTGSQPATRELLATIAGLPQGVVVLPGLDREIDEESWAKLDPSHPQFGLRELLPALSCERRDVAEWPGDTGEHARRLLIAELMRPAETTDGWHGPSPPRSITSRAPTAPRRTRRRW
jgi:ATP-dependent helicase/nuclease subunit B